MVDQMEPTPPVTAVAATSFTTHARTGPAMGLAAHLSGAIQPARRDEFTGIVGIQATTSITSLVDGTAPVIATRPDGADPNLVEVGAR